MPPFSRSLPMRIIICSRSSRMNRGRYRRGQPSSHGCRAYLWMIAVRPTVVVIEDSDTGRTSHLPVWCRRIIRRFAAYVRALIGPLTIHAAARRLPRRFPLAPGCDTRGQSATFTFPTSDADAAFVILPPGGVRRLRAADARHLARFPPWLWAGYGSPEAMLRQGIAYARYLRAELVALACTAATTERYDAIAAYTIERTRRNGFARECAHRLIGAIRSERDNQPVLIGDTENDAAIALARSLGLTARHDQTVYDLP